MIFSKIVCPRSRWLHWHFVSIVNDYTPIHHWLRGPFLKTLQVSHRFQRNMQAKKKFGCVYTANSNNLKIWKPPYLNKKISIFDLCNRISSRKRKSSRNRFNLLTWGPRSNLLAQIKWSNISWHCPFRSESKSPAPQLSPSSPAIHLYSAEGAVLVNTQIHTGIHYTV